MFASGQPEVHEVELARQSYPASQSQPASCFDPRAQIALPDRLEVVRQESLVPGDGSVQPSCAANDLRSRGATLKVTCRPWSSPSPSRPVQLPGSHCGFAQPLRLLCPAPAITDASCARALTAASGRWPTHPPRSIRRSPSAATRLPRPIRRGPSAHPPRPAAVRRAISHLRSSIIRVTALNHPRDFSAKKWLNLEMYTLILYCRFQFGETKTLVISR